MIIAFLFFIAYSARVTDVKMAPRFTLLEERSLDGAPSISIAFPDGYEDTLILNKFYPNDKDRMSRKERCHYTGHLANEPEACVAMTGCLGSEDVEFTILSKHAAKSNLLKWTKEGHVEIIDRSYTWQSERMADDGDEEEHMDVDENAFDAVEKDCLENGCSLPATQHLQIKVGYDDGLFNFLGGADAVEEYIAAVWTHMQVNFCHESLGSKILVELTDIKHYTGKILKNYDQPPGEPSDLERMWDETLNDRGSADLMMYFGYRGNMYWGGGRGHLGKVCEPVLDTCEDIWTDCQWRKESGWCWSDNNKKNCKKTCGHCPGQQKASIIYYGVSYASMGGGMAHEVGHNLGMRHDHDVLHGGPGNPCDGQGIMSYNGEKPGEWSKCSVADFTAQYTLYKDVWCLPAAPSACTMLPEPACQPDIWTDCQWRKDSGWCPNEPERMHCAKTCGYCHGDEDLKHAGEQCWWGCNQKQGKCDYCGADGWCCRKNWIGNGCDGSFGGPWSHQCFLNPNI